MPIIENTKQIKSHQLDCLNMHNADELLINVIDPYLFSASTSEIHPDESTDKSSKAILAVSKKLKAVQN